MPGEILEITDSSGQITTSTIPLERVGSGEIEKDFNLDSNFKISLKPEKQTEIKLPNTNVKELMYQALHDDRKYGLRKQKRDIFLNDDKKFKDRLKEIQQKRELTIQQLKDEILGDEAKREQIDTEMNKNLKLLLEKKLVTLPDTFDEEPKVISHKTKPFLDDFFMTPQQNDRANDRRSLKEQGITDPRVLASHLASNPVFLEFVKEHQQAIDSRIEETFGPNSGYARQMRKHGMKDPLKPRLLQFMHNNNVIRNQNPKIFSMLQKGEPVKVKS